MHEMDFFFISRVLKLGKRGCHSLCNTGNCNTGKNHEGQGYDALGHGQISN